MIRAFINFSDVDQEDFWNSKPFELPVKVDLSFSQQWTYETMKNTSGECEGTHFLCPNGMCLPVFLICNGVNDCSSRLDEYNCDNYACPGYYRYSPVNI